jgi:hypothetical protein
MVAASVDSAPRLGSRFSFCVALAATTIVVARHPPDEAAKNHPMV